MIGLDTNVLVRFLTKDDPAQFRRANALIEKLANDEASAFLSTIVLCELVWVLKGAYRYAREEIGSVILMLLETSLFVVEDRDLVRQAAQSYVEGKADFADYLIGATGRRSGCSKTVTFDTALRGVDGFETL